MGDAQLLIGVGGCATFIDGKGRSDSMMAMKHQHQANT